ncbi:MAG TPA: ATP-binding cassette domain-containing protein [Streptosporangiaceae bacterium]
MLVLRADKLRAARGVLVARQVELSAAPGDVVAVEGVNGSGKSTLLAAAAGLLPAGRSSRRPASVGYAPERVDVLPRVRVRRWLVGLARTAGLSRAQASGQVDDLLTRMGLTGAEDRPLRALSRGNAQRALVAQALLGPPELLVLDEPSSGLDADGLGRLSTEIRLAAGRSVVVLVARHPTELLPLPAGPTWRIGEGMVRVVDRAADAAPANVMEVKTGDGAVQQVSESELPAVLRAALDAGLVIRTVQPLAVTAADAAEQQAPAASALSRSAGPRRIVHGGAHRARLLAMSQWFAAPALLFLAVLGINYAGDAGPPIPAAAFTAVVLAMVMTWVSVLAHLVDGRLMARAFAAHVGGRGRARLAACLATAPFAGGATAVAWVWPIISQQGPHHVSFLLHVVTSHLAAAVFGVGAGTLLVPPLVERAGWRVCLGVAMYLGLLVLPFSPVRPLLLTMHAEAGHTVAAAAGVLGGTGAALIGLTTFLAARLP